MIGIFDSGLGGLTALKEAHRLLPHEDIVYFGDTGRVPYGTKSAEIITKYAMQDAAFLISKGVNAILVACGTVSTTALDSLKEAFPIPITGVVEPAAETAARLTKNGRVGIIGTSATVRSGAFERAVKRFKPDAVTFSQDCPLFVPLVESGFIGQNCEITRLACEHYLRGLRDERIDTLILGCTHYPIISEIISDVLPEVTLISSGAAAAEKLAEGIGSSNESGSISYYVSDDPKMFCSSASVFLGTDITGRVARADVEKL